MGPALETFLGVALLIALIVACGGWMTRPFWPRIANYFRRWYERDMRLEQQQREEADCREKARWEVGELCHDAERSPQTTAAQTAGSRQQTEQAHRQTPNDTLKSTLDTASNQTEQQTAQVTPGQGAERPAAGQVELHH